MFPHASVFPSKTQVVFKTFVHFEMFSPQREKYDILDKVLSRFLMFCWVNSTGQY